MPHCMEGWWQLEGRIEHLLGELLLPGKHGIGGPIRQLARQHCCGSRAG